MATEKFTNNASSTLNGSITNVATTLVITSATPFPTTGNFRILIDNEILLVTGVSGTTFTVTRGVESSTAASHSNAAPVTHIFTAGALAQTVLDNYPLTNGYAACTADTSPSGTSWSDVTGCSLSLGAGTWLLMACITANNTGAGNGNGVYKIYYGSTDLVVQDVSAAPSFDIAVTLSVIAVLSGTQTVKLAARNGSGTNVFKVFKQNFFDAITATNLIAIQIA